MRRDRGFTLVELLGVIVIFGFVAGILTHLAVHGLLYQRVGSQRTRLERDTALLLEELVHGGREFAGLAAAKSVTVSTDTSSMSYVTPDAITVTYALHGTSLERTVSGKTVRVLDNVRDFQIEQSNDLVTVRLTIDLPTPNGEPVSHQLITSIKLRNYTR